MLESSSTELLVAAKAAMHSMHYAYNTQRSYIEWIKRFLAFVANNNGLLPADEKIEIFLGQLSNGAKTSASTRNQARNALIFFYTQVLHQVLDKHCNTLRSNKEKKLPIVLDQTEMTELLKQLSGTSEIIVKLLYGSGLRITEAIRLRIRDLDFDHQQLVVRSIDGDSQRFTPLSENLVPLLKVQLQKLQKIHAEDIQKGYGGNYMNDLEDKQQQEFNHDWPWQYLFPSRNLSYAGEMNSYRRLHVDQSVVNKAIKSAMNKLTLNKKISAHTFRHSFATHLLQKGISLKRLQELMGHHNIETTKVYSLVLQQQMTHIRSPLDDLSL